ncbi:MAG TPA: flagellar motor switch protein FliM [Gammaproteobacteria bacterium]|nr:flagellar motor switch protein FliM [Gammaproteobacteria bacterium]
MGGNDILSQEEIDALLHGVDSGEVETRDTRPAPGEARTFDFTTQDRIVRGRMPTLEMINERFARYLRNSIFSMLRRTPEISVRGVEMLKFSEYTHSLFVPSSLNLVKVSPLRGTGLIVLDPRLVFTVIDNYFGGDGRFPVKIEGREFTPTEQSVISLLLERVFQNLIEAWNPVQKLSLERTGMEVNPHFANIVSPTEVVVASKFHIELDGGGGDLHVTLPYSMLEPLRELLDAGVQSDRVEHDERWARALREEVEDAEVELTAVFARRTVSLRDLVKARPGDVLYIDPPERITVLVEDVPAFEASFGRSRGMNAVRIEATKRRRRSAISLTAGGENKLNGEQKQ